MGNDEHGRLDPESQFGGALHRPMVDELRASGLARRISFPNLRKRCDANADAYTNADTDTNANTNTNTNANTNANANTNTQPCGP